MKQDPTSKSKQERTDPEKLPSDLHTSTEACTCNMLNISKVLTSFQSSEMLCQEVTYKTMLCLPMVPPFHSQKIRSRPQNLPFQSLKEMLKQF